MISVCWKSRADNVVALFWRSSGIRSCACWCLRAGDSTRGCFVFCLWRAGYIFQSEVNRGPSKSLGTFLLPHPLSTILLYFGPSTAVSPKALWFCNQFHTIFLPKPLFSLHFYPLTCQCTSISRGAYSHLDLPLPVPLIFPSDALLLTFRWPFARSFPPSVPSSCFKGFSFSPPPPEMPPSA